MTNIKIVRRLAREQYKEGTEPEVYDFFELGMAVGNKVQKGE